MCNSYDDIVLKGADVVAYFSLNENQTAVIGDSKFSSTYNGYTFYFSSHANKALFEASPESYAPQVSKTKKSLPPSLFLLSGSNPNPPCLAHPLL